MKLSNLLFLSETRHSYTPPEFALIKYAPNKFALINVPIFVGHSKFNFSKTIGDLKDFVASFAEVTPTPSKCLDAYQISIIAGNKDFRGAGKLMYGLVSDYYNTPITSDREHSSSIADKKTWKSIENDSSEFKNIGELDNFITGKNYVKYTKATDSYTDIPGPQTPDNPNDDCPLPTADGNYDPKKITGTPYAFTYNGSIKSQPLIENGKKVISSLENSFYDYELMSIIRRAVDQLWDERYTSGANTDK